MCRSRRQDSMCLVRAHSFETEIALLSMFNAAAAAAAAAASVACVAM